MDWIAVIITTARNRLPIESWTAGTKPDFSIYIKNLMLNIDRQNRNTDSCIKNLWTDALTSCSDWQHFYRLLNAYHVNKITKKLPWKLIIPLKSSRTSTTKVAIYLLVLLLAVSYFANKFDPTNVNARATSWYSGTNKQAQLIRCLGRCHSNVCTGRILAFQHKEKLAI
jgi:hypothetical protein